MNFQAEIEAYWNRPEQRTLLVDTISRLVAVKSVCEAAQPNAPFGPGPARCLEEALTICRELGFATENVDYYVGTADLNDKQTLLHILGHLDVVGEGKGWTHEPYAVTEENGLLYGRGVIDNKGPVAVALLAMKCVKDLGLELPFNAKLIMGTDEESGSQDIAYYFKNRPHAPYTFTPDANFPLINVEKGSYKPTFSAAFTPCDSGPRVLSLEGGFRINVIPGEAEALIAGLTAPAVGATLARVADETGVALSAKVEGANCRILAKGIGGHASTPHAGNNAVTALLKLLAALPLTTCSSTAAVQSLAALFPHGDHEGKALGMAVSDEIAGATSLSLTLLKLGEAGFEARFDSRTSLAANDENTRQPVEDAFTRAGFKVTGSVMHPPHHTPADSPIVKKLLACYEQYTGLTHTKPLAIGGGTYVHDIPGGVAFGCEIEGFECNMHGPDERIPTDVMVMSGKIFTQAILELCKENN